MSYFKEPHSLSSNTTVDTGPPTYFIECRMKDAKAVRLIFRSEKTCYAVAIISIDKQKQPPYTSSHRKQCLMKGEIS